LEPPQLLGLIISLVALIELFLLSIYEATFSVISRSSLERMQENQVSRASMMLAIFEPRHRLHLMTRFGQALGILALAVALPFFLSPFFSLQGPNTSLATSGILATTALIVLALFILTFLPQRIRFEVEGEETRIPAIALALPHLHFLLRPGTALLEWLAGDTTSEDFKANKEEELRSIVEAESETGVLEEGEKEMIEGVFGFHDSIVKEVMIPRVDITAIEQNATLSELLDLIKETNHSRIPVYEESLDHIRGMVFVKDLLQLIIQQKNINLSFPLTHFMNSRSNETIPFMHEPYYVPETQKIDALLRTLRNAHLRLAIVMDEYSGTAGLVTTEDLIEEIVGDIPDEYDKEEQLYHWTTPDQSLITNARIEIDDLNDLLETDLPKEGFETLGGFIYDYLGHVPSKGQIFQTQGLDIKILKIDEQRIIEVQVQKLPLKKQATEA
jgi:putative hemolysin